MYCVNSSFRVSIIVSTIFSVSLPFSCEVCLWELITKKQKKLQILCSPVLWEVSELINKVLVSWRKISHIHSTEKR